MSTVRRAKPNPRLVNVEVTPSHVVLHLKDGRLVAVPLWWTPKLYDASPEQRSRFEIEEDGYGVRWEELDEDLSGIGALVGGPVRWDVRFPKGDRWEPRDVREMREAMGRSITDFATELGVRRATVSDWERGVCEVSPSAGKLLDQMAADYDLDSIRGRLDVHATVDYLNTVGRETLETAFDEGG